MGKRKIGNLWEVIDLKQKETFLCIDLKSFYASVECVERGLDPFTTNLVVADPDRSVSTICLAITPAMKKLGIRNRCRIHEIPDHIEYIVAKPRMQLYMEYSARIYGIYLNYVAKEDIHVYSVDECFMDVTRYLSLYHLTAKEMAQKLMDAVMEETGITATAGIGTNLYLAKIAMDIVAKHIEDHIAPTSFVFKDGKTFQMGNTMGAVSYLQILAPELTDKMLAEFLDIDKDLIVNLHIQSVDQMKAIKLVKSKVTDINRMKIEEQKKAVRAGYDMDIIPSDLNTYGGEAKRLLEDLQSRNERMFLVTALFLNTAKSKQELENAIFQTAGIAQKYNCMLKRLDYQQEEGLMSSLPLGVNHIPIKRALTTTSTAIFVPFTTQELFMGGDSLYYGLNATSNNLIMVDRKKSKNPNGLILGTPGSGKSFAAKREMTNVFFTTKDDIIIGDPEGEYYPLVHALGGQVIHISPNSKDYINPMDINMNYSEDDNPLGVKSDFILSLCELIMGSRDGIEAEEKSVIDRCLPLVYQNYFSDPKPENMPTLGDLYDCLRKQKEPQAQRIATALEIYVNGSLKVFNHQTNVELNNRIVCFDIKELGKQLKKLGMLIIQDQVWNRVTINRGVKSTWYYIDEFHLLLKEEQTASYSVEIFKRFRKWGGIPTGITQNIKDLLSSREIENIFENSDFILMLNQAAGDRQILAKQLNISPYQLSYVTNSGEGEGLLFYGTTIIPFKDKFDKSLKLYSLMTTKPEEVEQREKEGGGSLGRERTERKRESCQ